MTAVGLLRSIEREAQNAVLALPFCCSGRDLTYLIAGADLVKIGCTTNLVQRTLTLQKSSPVPLRIIALARGSDFEKVLHVQMVKHRRYGEWFDLAGVLGEIQEALVRSSVLHECLACSVVLGPHTSFLRTQRDALARYEASER